MKFGILKNFSDQKLPIDRYSKPTINVLKILVSSAPIRGPKFEKRLKNYFILIDNYYMYRAYMYVSVYVTHAAARMVFTFHDLIGLASYGSKGRGRNTYIEQFSRGCP